MNRLGGGASLTALCGASCASPGLHQARLWYSYRPVRTRWLIRGSTSESKKHALEARYHRVDSRSHSGRRFGNPAGTNNVFLARLDLQCRIGRVDDLSFASSYHVVSFNVCVSPHRAQEKVTSRAHRTHFPAAVARVVSERVNCVGASPGNATANQHPAEQHLGSEFRVLSSLYKL